MCIGIRFEFQNGIVLETANIAEAEKLWALLQQRVRIGTKREATNGAANFYEVSKVRTDG